jgi:hypothetical protein
MGGDAGFKHISIKSLIIFDDEAIFRYAGYIDILGGR